MKNLEWAGTHKPDLDWSLMSLAVRLTDLQLVTGARQALTQLHHIPANHSSILRLNLILSTYRSKSPPRLAGKLISGTVQYNFLRDLLFLLFISIFSNFEFFKWQILVIVMLLFCRKSCSLCRQGRWSKVILAVSWSWAVATCSSRKSADSSKPVSTDVPCAGICLKPQVVFFYHHALKKNSFNSGIIMINLWKRRHTQHHKY